MKHPTPLSSRGLAVDDKEGESQLLCSLKSNRRISQWLDFKKPAVVQIFTGNVEFGQRILSDSALQPN